MILIVRKLIAILNLVKKLRITTNSHPDDDDQHMSESKSESDDDTPQQKQLPKKKMHEDSKTENTKATEFVIIRWSRALQAYRHSL